MSTLLNYRDFLTESYTIAKLKFDEDFNLAINYALQKHHHQIRKFDKSPYIYHPARVAEIVLKTTKDKDLAISAFLHDTLEDTNTNYTELKDTFGENVAKNVQSLTNSDKEMKKYGKLQAQIKHMMKMSRNILTIKLADRLDNVMDFETADKNFVIRYARQTNSLLQNLKNRSDLTKHHKELIDKIEDILFRYKKIWNLDND